MANTPHTQPFLSRATTTGRIYLPSSPGQVCLDLGSPGTACGVEGGGCQARQHVIVTRRGSTVSVQNRARRVDPGLSKLASFPSWHDGLPHASTNTYTGPSSDFHHTSTSCKNQASQPHRLWHAPSHSCTPESDKRLKFKLRLMPTEALLVAAKAVQRPLLHTILPGTFLALNQCHRRTSCARNFLSKQHSIVGPHHDALRPVTHSTLFRHRLLPSITALNAAHTAGHSANSNARMYARGWMAPFITHR